MVMDWDLWGPSYAQDSPESSFDRRQDEWKCDFYFGYGTDVIEEDALNEKSCAEVLRKLISKANIQIEELEEDLVILQTQLEWAEQNKLKEWFEICCKGLEEKTHFLELLIRNLKNENVQNECDKNFMSPMHGEPPRRISELVKALLGSHCQSKSEQPEEIAIKDSFTHGTNQSSDRESLSSLELGSSITDEIVEPSVIHADISLDSSIIVKDFGSDAFSNATSKFDDEKSSSSTSSKNIPTEDVKESNVPCINISLNPSMKPDGKLMNQLMTVTAQEADIFGTDNALAESPSAVQGRVAKDLSMSDIMAVQEPRIPAIGSTVNVKSHLKLQGQITKNKMLFNPVNGHEPCVPPIVDVISNSSSNSKGRERQLPGSKCRNNNAKSQKRAEKTVQATPGGVQETGVASNDNETSLRPPSKPKVNGRKNTKSSDIAKVKEASETPTEFLTLQGVTIEHTREEDLQLSNCCGVQEPGVVDDFSPPSKPQVKRKKSTRPLDVAKVKNPSETLQGDSVKSTSKEVLQIPTSCAVQGSGVVGDNLCPSSEPQVKESTKSSDTAKKSSDIAKAKEPSEISTELWTWEGGKVESTIKQDLHLFNSCMAQVAGVVGDSSYENLSLLSEAQEKISESTILSSSRSNGLSVAPEYSTLQGDTIEMKNEEGLEFCKSSVGVESSVASDRSHIDLFLQSKAIAKKRKRAEKDIQLPKSCGLSESHDKIPKPLPTSREGMMKLTLTDLRFHAKRRKMKKISSLRKADIIDQLLEQIGRL